MIASKAGVGNGIVPAWHTGFLLMEPAIRRQTHALFHHRPRQERDEALAEVTAVALMGYVRHLEDAGTEPFDSVALARSAARHVLNSGRVCGRESSRDVLSPTAQHRRSFKVEHLQPSCEAERLRMRIDLRQEGGEPSLGPSLSVPANGNGKSSSERFTHERSRRRNAEKRLHAAEIEFEAARRIQKKLLPAAPLALPGFEIAGLACPAEATGGDYFDFVPMLGGAVGVVVGDVSGHGFGPALLMASTRAYLRAFAQTHEDLGELLSLVNRVLNLDMEEDRFVTLVLARLDLRNRSLAYTSAGHPTGYILNASGQVRLRLPSTGPLLGPESDGCFRASPVVPLEAGELVLLLTDGMIEASAPDNTAFGWDRAVHVVRAYRHDPAARIVSNLYHAVRAFTQNAPQLDDMTAVIIKVAGREEPKNMSLENGVSTPGVETANVLTTSTVGPMPIRFRAVAFDLDAATLTSLREALPEWEFEVVYRATTVSLERDGNLGKADLLVVHAHAEEAETLGLCRSLRSQVGWAHTPLLVLIQSEKEAMVRAVLKAGAHSCLVLPVHAKELAHMVARTHEGNRPGRHTLNLHQAQQEDRWRDDGGQG